MLLMTSLCFGQALTAPTGSPTGACTAPNLAIDNTTGNVWFCASTTWTEAAGSANAFGSLVSGTNTQAAMVVSTGASLMISGTSDFTVSTPGAASAASVNMTGAPFTGGTGTTTFPLVYINDGAAPTTLSTSGTELGINSPSGFAGNFVDFHLNGGASVFSVSSVGGVSSASSIVSGGSVTGGAGQFFTFNGRAKISSPADGVIELLNNAGTGFTTLELGGATTTTVVGGFLGSYFQAGGTKFTASGCTNSATVGGATAGQFTSGTTGACTVTVTMGNTDTATNGWSCWASDQTTPANLYDQKSGGSTTTAVLSGTTVTGDVISFGCLAY